MLMQVMVQADYKEQEMEEMRIKDMKSTKNNPDKIPENENLYCHSWILILNRDISNSLVRNNRLQDD